MTETRRAIKLGTLLIGLEFITQKDLVAVMDMASQVGMPLGRALVLSGKITDPELKIALQLHSLMRTADVPMETAKKTFKLVCYQGMPLLEALQKTGWTPSVNLPKENSRLGKLLLESKLISEEQLNEAQDQSHKLGLPLGRILTLMGVISHPIMLRVIDLQSMIRLGRISHNEALEYLRAEAHPPSSTKPPQPAPKPLLTNSKNNVRLGELLIMAGILTESDLLNAVEISLSKSEPLGAVLIQMGLIATEHLRLALTLQEAVSCGSLDVQSATDTLFMETHEGTEQISSLAAESEESSKPAKPAKKDPSQIRLGELLKLCGFVDEQEIKAAIDSAHNYPSVIGRMLMLNGYIDESTLLAALRCQFLLRNHIIAIDQAIKAMQFAQQSHLSIDDALDELGILPHGKSDPT